MLHPIPLAVLAVRQALWDPAPGRSLLPKIIDLPHFVCEVCTVREIVGRELPSDPSDTALVMLERAHLIDTAHFLGCFDS